MTSLRSRIIRRFRPNWLEVQAIHWLPCQTSECSCVGWMCHAMHDDRCDSVIKKSSWFRDILSVIFRSLHAMSLFSWPPVHQLLCLRHGNVWFRVVHQSSQPFTPWIWSSCTSIESKFQTPSKHSLPLSSKSNNKAPKSALHYSLTTNGWTFTSCFEWWGFTSQKRTRGSQILLPVVPLATFCSLCLSFFDDEECGWRRRAKESKEKTPCGGFLFPALRKTRNHLLCPNEGAEKRKKKKGRERRTRKRRRRGYQVLETAQGLADSEWWHIIAEHMPPSLCNDLSKITATITCRLEVSPPARGQIFGEMRLSEDRDREWVRSRGKKKKKRRRRIVIITRKEGRKERSGSEDHEEKCSLFSLSLFFPSTDVF